MKFYTTPLGWPRSGASSIVMSAVRIAVLMFICRNGFAQTTASERSLLVKIEEEAVACDSSSNMVTVTMTFQNDSDHDILVYGLPGDLQAAPLVLSELCDQDKVGTGMAIALYHEDGTQEMPMIHMAGYAIQKSYKMPDSVRRAGETAFVQSAMVIGKHKALSVVKEVPLGDFYLEKGSYYLEVIYYCGKKISDVVNVKKLKKGKAELFQGCALSRRIPLTIR
jgi:hypothetical protein